MSKRIAISLILFFTFSSIQAQIDSNLVNQDPYSVIYNHLYYLQTDSYQPKRSTHSLPLGLEDSQDLSIKLKQVLDGKGMFVDLNRLPNTNNYIDSLTGEDVYFIDRNEPLIYLEKIDSLWYYSRTTMEAIPKMHQKIYPLGTQFFTGFQAPVWQVKFLKIKIWKWLGILVILILSWLLFGLVYRICITILRKIIRRKIVLSETQKKTLVRLSRLFGLLIAVRIILYLIPMLQIDPRLNAIILKGINILSIFFIILILVNIARIIFVYMEKAAEKTENTLDDQLLPVLEKLVLIIIWSFGVIYILDYLEVNVTALLAGISIGGLALALAAQDTVKNFFGSIMIFLDKPFQIGDWIHFNNVDGTIEEVGIRATRIRTFGNSITYVPNALLANSIIDNKGLRVYRRFKNEFSITYDTPPETIDKFVAGIKEILKMHPYTRKDYFEVSLINMGESALHILMYTFFTVPSWTEELQGKHQILTAVIKLADKLGVRFAFPTQTIHIEEIPKSGSKIELLHKKGEELNTNFEEAIKEIKNYFEENTKEDSKPQKEGDE